MFDRKLKIDEFARELQALVDKGSLEEAASFCRKAISSHPKNAELWRLAGIVALRSNDFEGAETCFQESVKLAPESAPAHSALASALLKKGERAKARLELEKSLSLDPRRAQDLESLATIMLKNGETDAARSLLSKSLALGLKCPNACALMASAELDAGNLDAAASLFVLAAKWSERAFLAIESAAISLMGKGAFESARLVLVPIAKEFPQKAELLCNLAICQMQTGRFDECFKTFSAVAALAPGDPVYLINCGTALYKTGRLEESAALLGEAVAADPSNFHADLALSLSLLKAGRLKDGWPHWESRLRQPDLAKLSRNKLPLWTPSAPLSARVLVRCEQGFGDSIFFARFLPLLRARCSHLAFVCRKELLPLFEGFPAIDQLIALDGDEEAERGCSFRLPLASLPRYFVESLDDIPNLTQPLFKAPASRLAPWRDFVASKVPAEGVLKVGLCWSGSQANILGRMRSIPDAALLPLLRLPGAAFFSLQADEMEDGLAKLARSSGLGFIATSAMVKDFADTAALIDALDLVVSIDTAVAHLAGAMLKPTQVALCYESDWRWFAGRCDSPWYPSMALHRQAKWGDWSGAMESIAGSLKA